MNRRFALAVSLCATGCLLLSACGGSSSGTADRPVSASSMPPSTSSSPTTSAAPTPTTSSASSAAPLSRFESDPAVRALRAWSAESARMINARKTLDAQVGRLQTAAMAPVTKAVVRGEIGYHYSGPVPFTPISVRAVSSTVRVIDVCVVEQGFSTNPKTGKPAQKYKKGPAVADMLKRGGRWIVANYKAGAFSCANTEIAEPSFS